MRRIVEPPKTYRKALAMLVEVRKFLLRNFFLPRPYFLRRKWFTPVNGQTGRTNSCRYRVHPWYVKPSFSSRWGPRALLIRLAGGVVPGDPKYFPEGYHIHELGPSTQRGKSEIEMRKLREDIRVKRGGCPIPI